MKDFLLISLDHDGKIPHGSECEWIPQSTMRIANAAFSCQHKFSCIVLCFCIFCKQREKYICKKSLYTCLYWSGRYARLKIINFHELYYCISRSKNHLHLDTFCAQQGLYSSQLQVILSEDGGYSTQLLGIGVKECQGIQI